MFQQVIDFRDESEALYGLLQPLKADQYLTQTQFKQWDFNDVIGHLHFWNRAADLSLADEAAFLALFEDVREAVMAEGLRPYERRWLAEHLDGSDTGPELLEAWRAFYLGMYERFGAADPRDRVQWAGPEMSVRSSITARQMETWAHGQAVYDSFGIERVDDDRIRNIVFLGVQTYGWAFSVRNIPKPGPMPYLRLSAPSGDVWEWGEENEDNMIEGSATAFCQAVTQVRHAADTDLQLHGDIAKQWMSIAQCFAGPQVDTPPPGSRYVQRPLLSLYSVPLL